MNLRPEHLPKGCETNAGKCTHVDKEGRVCGLYADMHRNARSRAGRKRPPNRNALVAKLELKIRTSILSDVRDVLEKPKEHETWGSPNMMCRCGAVFSEHEVVWPHQRNGCIGFTPKQEVKIVSCVVCRESFYSVKKLQTHVSTCTRVRELKVCCVGCQRHFYRVGMFNKHCKVIVCKWTRREVNYSLIADR